MDEYKVVDGVEYAKIVNSDKEVAKDSYVKLPAEKGKDLVERGAVELSADSTKKLTKKKKKEELLKKKFKVEEFIEKYLIKENPVNERLGCGIHKGCFYFGKKIWIDEYHCLCNAIVTDTKEIIFDKPDTKGTPEENLKDIQFKFGVHYGTDFEEPDFPWTNDGLKAFLSGEIKNVDKNKIFAEIVAMQDKAIVWAENEKLRPQKIVVKIIASYFHPIWQHFERESNVGHSTSGKSKKDEIAYYLGFNSIRVAKQSQADLYRTLDATCCWIFSENMDYLTDEERNAVNSIVEVGFDKRGGYARTRLADNKTGKWVVEKKAISGFMNYTSINALDQGKEATANRVDLNYNFPRAKESLTESEKIKYGYRYGKDPAFLTAAERLRTELRVLALENWKDVKQIHDTLKTPFSGRFDDKVRPILTIAKWLGDEVYADIVKYYERQEEQLVLDGKEQDKDFEFINALTEFIYKERTAIIAPTKTLIQLWYNLNYKEAEQEQEKNLYYKAQKELPRVLKSAASFTRVNIANNATAWVIKAKDLEYLRVSRGYTTAKEVADKLKAVYGGRETLLELSILDSPKITFSDLVPFFSVLDSKPKDLSLKNLDEDRNKLSNYIHLESD